jgi:hypothetical protein
MSLPIITADERLAEDRGVKACRLRQERGRQDHASAHAPGLDHAVLRSRGRRSRHRGAGHRHDPAAHLDGMPGLRGVHRRPEPGAARGAALQPGALPGRLREASAIRQTLDRLRNGLHRLDHCGGAALLPAGARASQRRMSEKTGKPDVRGAYGLHGREMIGWLTHLQHTRAKNVWSSSGSSTRSSTTSIARCSSAADRRLEDRPGAAGHRRRGADAHHGGTDGRGRDPQRAFVCHTHQSAGAIPAKDRSGRLDPSSKSPASRPADGEKIRAAAAPIDAIAS